MKLRTFIYPESIKMANLPTPIVKLENRSKALGDVNIYIKRDDYTGSEWSGNKIRKLEFVVAEAKNNGCDTLITCGGIQSNHARATAAVGAKMGMESYLVLKGSEQDNKNGNFYMDYMFGSKVKLITGEQYKYKRSDIMSSIKEELEGQGRKAYIIPEGASDGLGNFGYIKAFEEIVNQESELGMKFDHIVLAVGSGSTYAGLLMGSELFNREIDILGLNIYDAEADYSSKIVGLIEDSGKYLAEKMVVDRDKINIINDYVGFGYALSQEAELKFIKEFSENEGLILDTVYTGKGMYGLSEEIKKGRFEKGANILFVHTGGLFGMFSKNSLFE